MKENIIFIYLTVFGVFALGVGICNATELNSNEAEAAKFAQQTSDQWLDFFEEAAYIASATFSAQYSAKDFLEFCVNTSKIFTDFIEASKKFDFKNFKDNDLKYFFESIKDGEYMDEVVIGGERIFKIYTELILLQSWSNNYSIADYHNTSNELVYVPDIQNVIKSSNDSDELQYYWTEWRKISGTWAAKNFNTLIEGLKDAASYFDVSPLEFLLQKDNITDMENLMTEIRPLYMELHAFVRSGLQKKYGDSIIQPGDGLIPAHLFEQVLKQAWSNESIIEDDFPHGSLPPVESVMKKRFKAINLYEIADGFYGNLGFEKYPLSIWGDRIKLIETDNITECEVNVFYQTPNVYLEYCEEMNFMDFLEAYAKMGNLYYAKEMTGLPTYFFDPRGLEDAIGKAVILSSTTHHNLRAIGMIIDFNITQEVEMNRLLRKAIDKILNLPMDFVHLKLMADLLSEKIDIKQFNAHYWHLMDKYAGVGPPKDHESDTFDLPNKFFEDLIENKMARNFYMEILSFQMYKKFCELSGKYPKEPLYLCDMYGSKDVGNVLKEMMRLGSSKPFERVLERMFPENPKVISVGLLEYFKPIKNFLVAKNKKANVKSGWRTHNSDKI